MRAVTVAVCGLLLCGVALLGSSAAEAKDREATRVELGARVMTGFEHRRRSEPGKRLKTDQGWFLQQARATTRVAHGDRLRLKLSLELSDGLEDSPQENDVAFLRDAWVRFALTPAVSVQAGRFKRPWSRLELLSGGALPFRGRGRGNGLLVEDMGYGDRGTGVKIFGNLWNSGKRSKHLLWTLSATSPTTDPDTLDFHGRLQWGVARWLNLGAGVVQKISDQGNKSSPRWLGGSGYGADLRMHWKGLSLIVDGLVAEDLRLGNDTAQGYSLRPAAAALAGYLRYRFPVTESTELEPVLFGEWVDRDLQFAESESLRVVVGMNVLWKKNALRLMSQVELMVPRGRTAELDWDRREIYSLMLSSELR